jgi:hypothetical protein
VTNMRAQVPYASGKIVGCRMSSTLGGLCVVSRSIWMMGHFP